MQGQLTRQDGFGLRLERQQGGEKDKGATDKAGRSDNFLECSEEKMWGQLTRQDGSGLRFERQER